MSNNPETRGEVRSAIDAFEGKIVDYTKESLTIQMVGDSIKIDNFINLMKDFDILEICRTGIVSSSAVQPPSARSPICKSNFSSS